MRTAPKTHPLKPASLRRHHFWVGLLVLLGCFASASGWAGENRVERNGTIFYSFSAEPDEVELYWQNEDQKTFRQFSTLQRSLRKDGRALRFIMNGGLFEEDGSPCGLLVIDGQTLKPLNTRDGEGNFYLKPNGVFFIDADGAHIVSTAEYAAQSPAARLAIQSGPLLLRDGRIHPAFRSNSKSELHRNGVGVKADGSVLFAITEFDQAKRVNLHGFAEFFLAQGCRNALFLDGDLSQMMVDPPPDITPGNYFGTIFAATKKAQDE